MAITIVKKPIAIEQPTHQVQLKSVFAEPVDEIGKIDAEMAKLNEEIAALTKKQQDKLTLLAKRRKPLAEKVEALITEHFPSMVSLDPSVPAEEQELVPADNADETFVEKGDKYQLEIGKAGNARKVTDMITAKALIGEDTFMKLCKIDLKDVDAYTTPQEQEEFITKSRTKRPFVIAKKV